MGKCIGLAAIGQSTGCIVDSSLALQEKVCDLVFQCLLFETVLMQCSQAVVYICMQAIILQRHKYGKDKYTGR